MVQKATVYAHVPAFSDIDPETGLLQQVVLSKEQVVFLPDGDMSITLHGIKNDYSQDGFTVTIQVVNQS